MPKFFEIDIEPIDWEDKKQEQEGLITAHRENLGLPTLLTNGARTNPYGAIAKYFSANNLGGNTEDNEDNSNKTYNWQDCLSFFYHSDYLGSSSNITDITGEVYQHVEYFPFGETFVDERPGTYGLDFGYNLGTPYLYNGKELDEETGLYYYGARYYDPRISMWYGVDPKAEKYPGISPFAYVYNNPLLFFDPNGMEGEPGIYKMRVYGTFKLGAGQAGVNVSLFGVPIGGTYSLGAGEGEIKVWVDFYTSGHIDAGASYTERNIEKGSGTFKFGSLSAGESSEKETTWELNTLEGATKKEDKVYKDKKSAGVGSASYSESNRESVLKIDLGAEVNAVLIGVGANVGVEYYSKDSDGNVKVSTPNKTGASSQKRQETNTIKKEEYDHLRMTTKF